MASKIIAAGGLVVDSIASAKRVLLVHRPKYDDWSFPKGKLEPGESLEEAALREVIEETGLKCRIVGRLATSRYSYRTRRAGLLRPKVVHYFLMKRVSGSIRVPGDEIDRAEWFDVDVAARVLTYSKDRKLLKRLLQNRTIA